ncbi:MAG TPA: hypothetical protein VL326_32255 [Kofleriaceae bacterium]|nr:hypothetical protein [Kofleriaceae bacterium]
MGRAVALVGLLALASCYEQPSTTCEILCKPGGVDNCPDGMACNADGLCNTAGASCKGPTVPWASIGVGAKHVCGLSDSGEVYCWGDNSFGQVGTGAVGPPVPVVTKVPLPSDSSYHSLTVGADHTCVLDNMGKPWCWGQNNDGQTRGAGPGQSPAPVQTLLGQAPTFETIDAGAEETCGIGGGQLWCWGDRNFTNGTQASQATRVGTLGDWTNISCGNDHCCGISTSMGVLCFGANNVGQLGTGSRTDSPTPVPPSGLPTAGKTPIAITARYGVSCTILSGNGTSGELYCWGLNTGTDIIDQTNNDHLNPIRMGTESDWTRITLGSYWGCAERGGRFYCFGTSGTGGLGNGKWGNYDKIVTDPVDLGPADELQYGLGPIDTSDDVEVGCRRTGTQVDCWGDNAYGGLALGSTSRRAGPVLISPPSGRTWKHVEAGHHHTCATLDNNVLYCWGGTSFGAANAGIELGNSAPCVEGEVCDLAVPTAMPAPIDQAEAITAGDEFSCARNGSSIYCWGASYRGYTGPGSSNPIHPLVAPSAGTWSELMGGDMVTCGTTTANDFACWGYVPAMQTDSPMSLGISGVRSVAFGENSGCVVTTGDFRTCWGSNNRGQLGMGSAGSTVLFGNRMSVGGVASMDFDDEHACSLMVDGTVRCWGSNDTRESGSSITSADTLAPQTIKRAGGSDLTQCTAVSIGADYSCALCNGRVFCWGTNERGELGRDSLYSYPSTEIADEVKLPAGAAFIEMSAGHHHGCAMNVNGELYCWGDSLNGQVGDGTQSKNLPQPVGR